MQSEEMGKTETELTIQKDLQLHKTELVQNYMYGDLNSGRKDGIHSANILIYNRHNPVIFFIICNVHSIYPLNY
jgi:hypothetical protein